MSNGWTGGQYSLLRVVLAVLVALQLHGAIELTAIALCLLLAAGWFDRLASAGLLGLLLWRGPGPLAVVLLTHLLQPPAPYGSLAARGRTDPGGEWRCAPLIFGLLWCAAATWYATAGWKTGGPALLLLAYPPLSLVRRARPWIWGALLPALVASPELRPLLPLHLFTFDPAWIPPRRAERAETLFYDGGCGLCHRAVRFVLAEDARAALHFAPLDSLALRDAVPEPVRASLPDSLVLLDTAGKLHTRSAALLGTLTRLGGLWRLAAALLHLIPRPLRDLAYDGVARVRHLLFTRPADTCPVAPPALRRRFLT